MFKNRHLSTPAGLSQDLAGVMSGLQGSIDNLKSSHSHTREDINSTILLKTPGKQMILTALHEGTEVFSFQSTRSVLFDMIEGKLFIRAGREEVLLEKGQSLELFEKVEYCLNALDETMFLLTVTSEITDNQGTE